jgi:NADPH:quinone reductase-like Zn-dependent oxidoreductase
MKAIICTDYGPTEVLQFKEVAKPIPKDNEILIKVKAASINSWDWDIVRGIPFMNRLGLGLLKPKYKIPGADIAGQVEAIGKNIKQFQTGDEVFGDISGYGWGGYAEYVCVRKNILTLKSASMTFEEAAAIPQAAVMALQALRDKGQIQSGQKVLINGAGGGAGTFAVQIAKSFGAEVTGVDSTEKLDIMRSIGADHVIDYTQEDFMKNGQLYDLIIDVVTYHSIFDYKRVLSSNGIYVMLGGGSWPQVFKTMILGSFLSMLGNKKFAFLVYKPNKSDLNYLKKLFEAGKVKSVIDKCFKLNEVPEAFQYFGEGHVKGKIIITTKLS